MRGLAADLWVEGCATGQEMKLVTYNIHYGFGRDGHNDLDRIAAAIEDADVAALQEVERYWPRSGMVDQVALLAKRLPDHWIAFGPMIDVFSPAGYPGDVGTARRQFGNAIFSKFPLLSQANVLLPRPTGGDQTMQRGALEVAIASSAGPVRLYSVHLDYLSPVTRAVQIEALTRRDRDARTGGGAWEGRHAIDHGWLVGDEPARTPHSILLGDFNIAANTAEYTTTVSALEGFRDSWQLAVPSGSGATKDGARIDHIWVSDGLSDRVRTAWVDEHASGSDHRPSWVEIDL